MNRKTLIQTAATAILLAGLHSCSQKNADVFSIDNHEKLDSILDHYVDNDLYPFLYARLESTDGTVIYEHSAVNEELVPGAVLNGQTWFRIWSMSKIVTISLVMDLVEDGILSLEDPVTKYIPEFQDLKVAVNPDGIELSALKDRGAACPYELVDMDSEMTIYHLITHQAGFYYATTGMECLDSVFFAEDLPKSTDTDDAIARLAELPLVHQPGNRYYYGTNTTILGFVAERATGMSLKQLVEERMTGPMNIKGLQYTLPDGITLLPTITGKEGPLRVVKPGEMDIFSKHVVDYDPAHELYLGGEGMLANAGGYADFCRMMLNKGELNGYRFLDPASIETMSSPHVNTDHPSWGYDGFNLWVTGDSVRIKGWGDSGLWQGGGYEGTQYWIDNKRGFTGILMTQVFWLQPGAWRMYNNFRGELYRAILEKERNN